MSIPICLHLQQQGQSKWQRLQQQQQVLLICFPNFETNKRIVHLCPAHICVCPAVRSAPLVWGERLQNAALQQSDLGETFILCTLCFPPPTWQQALMLQDD